MCMCSVWWLTTGCAVVWTTCRVVDCIAIVLQGPVAAQVTRAALEEGHLVHHAPCLAVEVGRFGILCCAMLLSHLAVFKSVRVQLLIVRQCLVISDRALELLLANDVLMCPCVTCELLTAPLLVCCRVPWPHGSCRGRICNTTQPVWQCRWVMWHV